MRFRPSLPLIAVLALASSLGCSSSSSDSPAPGTDGGGTGASGVDGSKLATATSDDDRKKICDWSATLWGGYAKTHDAACDGGQLSSPGPTSQSDCVGGIAALPAGCPATVKQIEDCLSAQASASPCDVGKVPAECAIFADPRCLRASDAGTDSATDSATDASGETSDAASTD